MLGEQNIISSEVNRDENEEGVQIETVVGDSDVMSYESRQDQLNEWQKEKIKEHEGYLEGRLEKLSEEIDHYMNRGDAAKNKSDIIDHMIPITIEQCITGTDGIDREIQKSGDLGNFAYELNHLKEIFLKNVEEMKTRTLKMIEEKREREIKKEIGI